MAAPGENPSASGSVADDPNDDAISLTSTNDGPVDEDMEFIVEQVLSQSQAEDGEKLYLIKWEHYPMQACTWEPESNLGAELIHDLWEEEIARPDYQPFDMDIFYLALEQRMERHRRRNVERRRRGLPLTEPLEDDVADDEEDDETYQPERSLLEELQASGSQERKSPRRNTVSQFFLPNSPDLLSASSSDDDLQIIEALSSAPPVRKSKTPEKEKHKGKGKREENAKEKEKEKEKEEPKPKPKPKQTQPLAQRRKQKADEVPAASPTEGPSKQKPSKQAQKEAQTGGQKEPQLEPQNESQKETTQGARKGQGAAQKDAPEEMRKERPKEKSPDKSVPSSSANKGKAPERPSPLERMRKSASSSRSPTETLFDTDRRQQNRPSKATRQPKPSPNSVPSQGNQPARPRPPPETSSGPRASSVKISGGTKTFSARKSGSGSQEALGNAFSGGKVARRRHTLETAVSDPSRPGALFNNFHQRRLAELRGRSKEDVRIDPSMLSTKLFPITQGPSNTGAVSPDEEPPSATMRRRSTVASIASDNAPSPQTTATSPENRDNPVASKPKRRKTVRFFDDSDETPSPAAPTPDLSAGPADDPMDDMFVPQGAETTESTESTEATESIEGTEETEATEGIEATETNKHSLKKKLVLGYQGKPVEVSFEDVPAGAFLPLLQEFLDTETLDFGHACFAETFTNQFIALRQEILFTGAVAEVNPAGDAKLTPLETASEKLKAMASGVLLFWPAFGILLYPPHSDDWKEELLGIPAEASASKAKLRYVVFSTQLDCPPFLRSCGPVPSNLNVPTGTGDREHLLRTMFHFDRKSYMRLFPASAQKPEVQRSVFFAFPSSLLESMQAFALLFRTLDPACQIFFSSGPGAWAVFKDNIVARGKPAAVLIHELATWTVRRFPGLANVLDNHNNCSFWSFSQSFFDSPMYPPDNKPGSAPGCGVEGTTTDERMVSPGHINLTPLFPGGIAVLVTPSFIVSEPLRAYELFEWFVLAQASAIVPIKLVVASKILPYLEELADEKYKLRQMFMGDKSMKALDRQMKSNLNGVTPALCEHRYKTWLLVSEIFLYYELGKPRHIYQEHSPLVFVDEAISEHDEQSLVNWFGWWSMLHLDQFREFYVVGSNIAIKRTGSERAKRCVPFPRFSKKTVADPDAAAGRVLPYEIPETAPNDANAASSMVATSTRTTATATVTTKTAPVAAEVPPAKPQQCKSKRFPNDSPKEFKKQLLSYNIVDPGAFWTCYGFAVMWKDADEAVHFGMETDRNTIEEWLVFTWPFRPDTFRTYFGLFYTVEDSCYRDGVPRGRKLPRHPWVMIYRPEQPHRKPFRTTELIIWDARARDRFRNIDSPKEEDLTLSQRAAIAHVRHFGPVKNPELPLTSLWIGSEIPVVRRGNDKTKHGPVPGSTSAPQSENELDATMEYLDTLTGNFKDALPPTEAYLKQRGFKRVAMTKSIGGWQGPVPGESGSGQQPDAPGDPMDLDSRTMTGRISGDGANDRRGNGILGGSNDDEDENAADEVDDADIDTKMVFHPPRGTNTTPSKCRNRLADSCRLALAKEPNAKAMLYAYRPTMDWYEEQVAEGRGYAHMEVNSWEAFFNRFRIGQQGDGSSKDGTPTGVMSSPLSGANSTHS